MSDINDIPQKKYKKSNQIQCAQTEPKITPVKDLIKTYRTQRAPLQTDYRSHEKHMVVAKNTKPKN